MAEAVKELREMTIRLGELERNVQKHQTKELGARQR